MKAVRVVGYHLPMELQDVDTPSIEGPLDVIVRVGAAGVCRTDIHICDGKYMAIGSNVVNTELVQVNGSQSRMSHCHTLLAMRMPDGFMKSAQQ